MLQKQINFMGEYHRIKAVQALNGEIIGIVGDGRMVLAGIPALAPGHTTPSCRQRVYIPLNDYTHECGFVQWRFYGELIYMNA